MNKIPKFDFKSFSELEGKLNTVLIMLGNDKVNLSIKDLTDYIEALPVSSREKIKLAISAMITLNTMNLKYAE